MIRIISASWGTDLQRVDGFADWWDAVPHRERALGKGEMLFHRDDPVNAMFRVERGQVRLERRTIDGRLLILHSARPGELIAEASLFAEAYHCDATASEESVVSVCPKAELLAAMAADPARMLQLTRMIAHKLQDVRHKLELRNVRSASDRVLLYLELKADSARAVTVEGSLQDLASELGLTREAFYRTLASLERSGEIRRDYRRIILN